MLRIKVCKSKTTPAIKATAYCSWCPAASPSNIVPHRINSSTVAPALTSSPCNRVDTLPRSRTHVNGLPPTAPRRKSKHCSTAQPRAQAPRALCKSDAHKIPSDLANSTTEIRVRPWSSSPSYVRYPAQRKAPRGFVATRVRYRVTRTSLGRLGPASSRGAFCCPTGQSAVFSH